MVSPAKLSFSQFGKWAGKTRARRIFFRSMLMPGLGHSDLGYRKEAAILFGIAMAVIASGAAFHPVFFLAAPVFWLAQGADAARLVKVEEKTVADAKMESEKSWWD